MTDRPVIISACLLGLRTRYDGTGARSEEAIAAVKGRAFIPVCPEQLGGMPTPRPCAWIEKGDGADVLSATSTIIDTNGVDVTGRFVAGAEAVLQIARLTGATEAFLKEKSPSCGVSSIKRGMDVISGSGVTATMLKETGIAVRGF
ncbi:MAG: DUF523 domain-containing protein [Deltaproteobacteria bacterium]|nr:DUF523 domain-containing protein [Deltaproteobacteria bacterium]